MSLLLKPATPTRARVAVLPEEHEYFGCAWKRALSKGVWVCMHPTCAKQAFCPRCVPGQQSVPGKVVVHYCVKHRQEVTQ